MRHEASISKVKKYLKTHWIPMLFGALPAIAFTLIGIITFIINLYISFQRTQLTVEADTQQIQSVSAQNQLILQNEVGIKQRQVDQGQQLDDIHRYIFGRATVEK